MTQSPARGRLLANGASGDPRNRSENPRARMRKREAIESKLSELPMRTNFVTIRRTVNCGLRGYHGCSNSNGCGFLSSITLDEPIVYCYNDLSLDEHR